jgi:hypothetical protein
MLTPSPKRRLQPGGDVDPVAKEIRAFDNDVPEMDADAEAHLLARGPVGVLLGDCLLHRDGTLERIDRAGEVRHHAVAGGIEDSTMMDGDQSVEDRPVRLKCAQCADFVQPHQAAVLGNIGRKDYRELSFDGLNVCHLPSCRALNAGTCSFAGII